MIKTCTDDRFIILWHIILLPMLLVLTRAATIHQTLVFVSPAALSRIREHFGTCNCPKNQQISGQNLPVSELALRSYISGENLCFFRAMCETI